MERWRTLGIGGRVRQSGSRLGGKTRDPQLRLVDDALAHVRELGAALEQLNGTLELQVTVLELFNHLLQLAECHLEAAPRLRIRAQRHQPYWPVDHGATECAAWRPARPWSRRGARGRPIRRWRNRET